MKSVLSQKTKETNKNFLKNRSIFAVIFFVVLILALLPSLYFYRQYQKSQNLLTSKSSSLADSQNKEIVAAVGKLFELPTNEQPTIATVSDKTKLENQPFFAKAQNGDKVLIYSQNKQAILYRPSMNKIISIGTINPASSSPASGSPTASPASKNPTIELYNGTKTIGLTTTAENAIKAKLPNADIKDKDNASNQNYENTIIVDLSGNQSKYAKDLAVILGGKVVSTLPSGEVKPNTDILVILGKDFVK